MLFYFPKIVHRESQSSLSMFLIISSFYNQSWLSFKVVIKSSFKSYTQKTSNTTIMITLAAWINIWLHMTWLHQFLFILLSVWGNIVYILNLRVSISSSTILYASLSHSSTLKAGKANVCVSLLWYKWQWKYEKKNILVYRIF